MDLVWINVYDHSIDSTNARWVHWVSTGNLIKLLYDYVDGFVYLGGTDTKSHAAAAFQFMFPNIGKPIILTGGQRSIFYLGDDSTNNLYFAILCALSDISGAHVSFANRLLHGLHVHKVRHKDYDAFSTPPEYYLGKFNGKAIIYPNCPKRNLAITSKTLKLMTSFMEGVHRTRISPATPSESILHDACDPTCSTLLLTTLGAGNVRDERLIQAEKDHIECLRMLYDVRYPVVLGTPMMDGAIEPNYLGGAKAVSIEEDGGGAISGGNTSGATLEVKCMVALASSWNDDAQEVDYTKFRTTMETNLVGELH